MYYNTIAEPHMVQSAFNIQVANQSSVDHFSDVTTLHFPPRQPNQTNFKEKHVIN